MAEIKVTHPEVLDAEKAHCVCMVEAQALAQLLESTEDESPFCTLAYGVIDRLTIAFANYETALLRHGVASIEDRMGEDIQ